ncbi:MAG: MFS transporter [Dehalococcoidia bacterium]|nr:MFS transporter [Dehalococcoidia bacterium]
MRRRDNRPGAKGLTVANLPGAASTSGRREAWRKYLRRILFAQLIVTIGFGFSTPFMPLFVQQLGAFDSRQAALLSGIVAALNGPVMFIAGPAWGILSDWFGHKRNVLRAAFGASGVMVATGLVQNVYQLMATRPIMGAVTGVFPAMMGLMASIVPKERLAYGVGLLQAISALGNTIGPLVGGLFVTWIGYRGGFFVSGALIGTAGILVLFTVHEAFHPPPTSKRNVAGVWREVRSMTSLPGVWPALGVLCLVQLAPNLIMPVVPFFLKSLSPDIGPITIGLFFTLMGLSMTLSAWSTGLLADKLGLRMPLILGCLVSLAGAVGASLANTVALALVFGALMGAGIGVLTTSASTLVGIIAPSNKQGAAFGIVQSANAVGWSLGPLLGGLIANAAGLRVPFVFEAALFVILGAFALTMRLTPFQPTGR